MRVRRLEIRAFGGSDVIQVVEDPALPEPGEGEVRIKPEASSLVFTDMLRQTSPTLRPWANFTSGCRSGPMICFAV